MCCSGHPSKLVFYAQSASAFVSGQRVGADGSLEFYNKKDS